VPERVIEFPYLVMFRNENGHFVSVGGGSEFKTEKEATAKAKEKCDVNVCFWPIPLKKAESSFRSRGDAASLARLSCHWDRHRNQFRKLSEVLGGCCEDELVTRTVRPAQS
jgi:hypothetical protein